MKLVPLVLALPLAALCGSTAAAQTLLARINSGGPAVLDGTGHVWSADAPYSAGTTNGYVGGSSLTILSRLAGALVGGVDNPLRAVYAKARVNWQAYRFDVASGDYVVRLTLAETWNQGPGLRSMSVDLEGAPFLVDLDLAQLLGVQYGGQVCALVHVADGRLDVEADPGPGVDPTVDAPLISGIEVWSAPATFPNPPVPNGLEATAGFGENLLRWSWEQVPVAKWRVWRKLAEPGPHVTTHPPPAGNGWVQLGEVWNAPPRFHDRTAPAGVKAYYRIAAVGLDGSLGARSAIVSATALDTAEATLPIYEIELDAEDQLFIDANILTLPDEEVPATFTASGTTRAAETRYRGNTSRFHSKKSWKVKFSSSNAFEGRRDLNLKGSLLDPGLIREHLANELFEAVGQVAYEVRPLHLQVNGKYLGVFNEAEEIDQAFLAVRDRDPGGDIFDVSTNMGLLPSLESYQLLYEKETNEDTGHAALIDFVEFVNAPDSPAFVRDLAGRFDLDSYLSYLAVIAWIGDIDSVLHNFFLHQDLSLDRWEFLPWDDDITFGLTEGQMDVSILYGAGTVPGEPTHQLRKRVLAKPELLWRFCQKITELEERYANSAWLTPVIDAAAAERRHDAQADPYKYGWESAAPFEADIAELREFAALRTPIVDAEIAAVQPLAPPTPLWINELAAESQTQFLDEQGEAEDWVELYNGLFQLFDVSGLYLTDDLSDPTRWRIPDGTLVGPSGHVLIWCDGELGEGPLHAPFELAAAGGELGLFASDGTTLLDFVSWNRQYPEQSYGRFRDGAQFFRCLPTPTAGFANTETGNLPPALTWVTAQPPTPRSDQSVTLTCHATDADGLAAVELHWRANGGSFTTVSMSALGADRFGATIPALPAGTLVEYWFAASDVAAATSSKPAAGPDDPFDYTVTDSALASIEINEFCASNTAIIQDEFGDFEDWIELHNGALVPFDLGGLFLSDDLDDSTKWEIPAGIVIPAGGYLLFWADDEGSEGPLHAAFKLGAGGEDVALFDTLAAGNGLIDGLSYGPQTANVSSGSLPDGGNSLFTLSSPSPLSSNLPAAGASRAYDHADPAANPVSVAVTGPTAIGGSIHVQVSGALASQPGTIFFGLAPADVPFGSGFALIAPPPVGNVGFITDISGAASESVSIQNDPMLIGTQIYTQATVNPGTLSNAVVSTIAP